jgi:putative NADH-flavin reductase
MEIFLIGANNGLGYEILNEALRNKINVNCLVRSSKKINFESPYLKLFYGDATNFNELLNSIGTSSVIISSINVKRKNFFPWSKISNSTSTISDSSKLIVDIAKLKQINRVITISAFGVGETYKNIPKWFQLLIKYSNLKYPYKDHQVHEKIISTSGLNWTIIRPVVLTNFKKNEKIKITYKNHPKPNLIISRKSLAKFIIKILDNKDFYQKKPVVSKK